MNQYMGFAMSVVITFGLWIVVWLLNSLNPSLWNSVRTKIKISIAFWIWRHLSSGELPFYIAPKLEKYKAHVAPCKTDWRGWKLEIWNRAVGFLVSQGKMSYTPTLREKF